MPQWLSNDASTTWLPPRSNSCENNLEATFPSLHPLLFTSVGSSLLKASPSGQVHFARDPLCAPALPFVAKWARVQLTAKVGTVA